MKKLITVISLQGNNSMQIILNLPEHLSAQLF